MDNALAEPCAKLLCLAFLGLAVWACPEQIWMFLIDLCFLLWEWSSVPLFLPGMEWSVPLLLKQGMGKDSSAFLFGCLFHECLD